MNQRLPKGYLQVLSSNHEKIHVRRKRSVVRQGNRIKAGQVIGRVGDTGMSRGNHLHFELHIGGEPVNPLLYIQNPEELEEGA